MRLRNSAFKLKPGNGGGNGRNSIEDLSSGDGNFRNVQKLKDEIRNSMPELADKLIDAFYSMQQDEAKSFFAETKKIFDKYSFNFPSFSYDAERLRSKLLNEVLDKKDMKGLTNTDLVLLEKVKKQIPDSFDVDTLMILAKLDREALKDFARVSMTNFATDMLDSSLNLFSDAKLNRARLFFEDFSDLVHGFFNDTVGRA